MSKEINLEQLEKWFTDILKSRIEEQKDEEIVFYQGCKTYGAVKRSLTDLNLCGDRACPSCSMIDNALYEEAKKFINEKE